MNRHRCERIWQAEAREDGRLEKRDLTSFERHAANCPECTQEIATLKSITQKMSTLPEPERSELEHRRARNDLLRRANEEFLKAKPASAPWKAWVLASATVLGLSAIMWQQFGRTPMHTPTFQVVDMTNAVWQTETNASTSRVTMRSGTAAFHVEHLQTEEHFFVDMPDGRIEVRGTKFVVDVAEGKTRSVEVTDGFVWLDVPTFHGLLHAGERWPKIEASLAKPETSSENRSNTPNSQPEEPAPSATESPSAIATPPLPGKTISTAPSAPSGSTPPADVPAPVESTAAPKDDAGPRFADAMAAFTGGDDGRADKLFADFIRDFPRDGRAEDAMFLRAKARARHGDSAGAAAIAREYLRAFPRGFRRPEAERLAGEGK